MGEGTIRRRALARPVAVAVVTATAVLLSAACTPEPTAPPHAVDQQNATRPRAIQPMFCGQGDPAGDAGQSFTPSRSGIVDQVSLVIQRAFGPGDFVLQAEIRTVDAYGLPTSQIIGSGTFQGPSSPELPAGSVPTDADFIDIGLSQPASVVGGRSYSIVVREPGAFPICPYAIGSSSGYPPGSALLQSKPYLGEDIIGNPTWGPDTWNKVSGDLFFKVWMRT